MIINNLKITTDRQEQLQRVVPDFPVSIYQTDFSYADYQKVNWHWHEDFQFCWVTKGPVRFQVVSQVCQAAAGQGIFINKKLAHTAEPLTPLSAYYSLNFIPQLICPDNNPALKERLLLPVTQNDALPCLRFDNTMPEGALIIDTMRRIIKLSESSQILGWELLVHSELLQLWPAVLQLAQTALHLAPDNGGRVSTQANQRLQKIIMYLNAHYQEKVMLKSVADEVFLCPEECERFFKRVTGKTIFEYLMQYRIEKSREYLRYTDMTIAEAAQRSGFASQSYFSVCFKKQVGYTPNQYRIKIQARNAASSKALFTEQSEMQVSSKPDWTY